MKASVSILAADHFAFAVMQPGCFLDTTGETPLTRLVLEGYWRYLDESEPESDVDRAHPALRLAPGDHRLRVQRAGLGSHRPAGRPASGARRPRRLHRLHRKRRERPGFATHGELAAGPQEPAQRRGKDRPSSWAPARGDARAATTAGSPGTRPRASILAAQLGADYLEIDVRLTKDQVPVFIHQGLFPGSVQGIYCTGWVEDYTYAELLANCRLRNGEVIPRVADMLEFIYTRTNLPTWLDSKSPDVIVPVSAILGELQKKLVSCNPPPPGGLQEGQKCLFPGSAPVWERGIIALPSAEFVTAYKQALAAGQLAPNQHCLIEEDPSAVTGIPCVAWKPRYTLGPMTNEMQSLQQQGFFTGYWTINDPGTMDAFLTAGVPNGILTNRVGLLNQRFEMVGTTPPYTPYRLSTP